MKTSHLLYIAGIFFLSFSSCEGDWLNIDPSTAVNTDKAITTEEDAQIALNGLYRVMSVHGYYSDNYIYYGEAKGQDMQCRENATSNRGDSYYTFSDRASDASTTLTWQQPYIVIRQANNIITQIDEGKVTTGNTDEIARIKAEALAVRGLALFDLTRLYGRPYTEDNGSSPGVPILLKAEGPENNPSRNTVAECYNQAIKDMTDALPSLRTGKTNGFINSWTVKALLSRIYLYMGDNKNALKYAEDVIEGSPYTLWSHNEYASIWGQDFSSESIFELIFTLDEPSGGTGGEGVPMVYSQDGYNALILTKEYLDMLQSDPNDVRIHFTAYEKDDKGNPITTGPRKYLVKYPGKNRTDPRDNNICLIRLSEVYLTAAETAFKTGDRTKALEYLNKIVSRANPEKQVSDSELTLERILIERRKELVGEGQAFFDLVRNNLPIIRKGGWQLELGSSQEIIHPNEDRLILPIPQAEIDANPNMEQNKGL